MPRSAIHSASVLTCAMRTTPDNADTNTQPNPPPRQPQLPSGVGEWIVRECAIVGMVLQDNRRVHRSASQYGIPNSAGAQRGVAMSHHKAKGQKLKGTSMVSQEEAKDSLALQ